MIAAQPSLVRPLRIWRIGLLDALLVLDEREPDVALAARTEAEAGRERDLGLLHAHRRELEARHLGVGLGIGAQTNIVPFGFSMCQPMRSRPSINASRRPR